MTGKPEHYEAIEFIVRSRADGRDWFEVIEEFLMGDCEELDPNTCSCGVQTISSSGGTLDECYEWTTNLVAGVSPLMVARAIENLVVVDDHELDPDTFKIVEWARNEIAFEAYWENREQEEDE